MKILLIGMDGLQPKILLGEDVISEQLGNFHRLMEIGCYGRLNKPEAGEAPSGFSLEGDFPQDDFYRIVSADRSERAEYEAETGWDGLLKKVIAHSSRHFAQVVSILKAGQWKSLQYQDGGLQSIRSAHQRFHPGESASDEADSQWMDGLRAYYLHLNEQLGSLFENIEEDLVFMIVSNPGDDINDPGFFILASPNNPLGGEVEGAKLNNIGPTLFELAGYPVPDSEKEQSLVAGKITEQTPEQLSKEEEDILRERLSGLGYI